MTYMPTKPTSLFDLLARQWTLSSPVEAAIFSSNSGTVAFAGFDGTMWVVTTSDPDSPTKRMRQAVDAEQQTIRPRKGDIAPATKVACSKPRSSKIVAFGKSGFLFGTSNGQVALVTPQGSETHLDAAMNGPVAAVAAMQGGTGICFAAGSEIVLCEDKHLKSPAQFQATSPVISMTYSPDDLALAVAHETGIAVWDISAAPKLRNDFSLGFPPQDIRWSANGQWIAGTLGEHGATLVDVQNHRVIHISDFPTGVHSLSFSAVVNAIAISGAFRAAAWSLAELRKHKDTTKSALRSGRPGLVPVDSVAACPTRNILAVGYASGLLNLTQIGGAEELVLDQDSDAGISVLAWAGNGKFLAIGRADGVAALAEFPAGMFKQ